MLWFTHGTCTKPVLIVTSVAALLTAAPSPGRATSTLTGEPIPVELYTEPHPDHLQVPDCSFLGTRAGHSDACELLDSGAGGWARLDFMVDPTGKPFDTSGRRSPRATSHR
jgi:hypothetical protein